MFGICCEGIPQQVNFLIDEVPCASKGSNSVISYLDYFVSNFGQGKCTVPLHCDNCSGQNTNQYMLWYLLYRCCMGLHREITLNFLITGHTKFAPDWCFGLFKQAFRRNCVSCLNDIAAVVNSSTVSGVNIAQLIGDETGETFVQVRNWQQFLEPQFNALPNIKSFHHFRFSSSEPRFVFGRLEAGSPEIRYDLHHSKTTAFTGQSEVISSPGLDIKYQRYLLEHIRDYCDN